MHDYGHVFYEVQKTGMNKTSCKPKTARKLFLMSDSNFVTVAKVLPLLGPPCMLESPSTPSMRSSTLASQSISLYSTRHASKKNQS